MHNPTFQILIIFTTWKSSKHQYNTHQISHERLTGQEIGKGAFWPWAWQRRHSWSSSFQLVSLIISSYQFVFQVANDIVLCMRVFGIHRQHANEDPLQDLGRALWYITSSSTVAVADKYTFDEWWAWRKSSACTLLFSGLDTAPKRREPVECWINTWVFCHFKYLCCENDAEQLTLWVALTNKSSFDLQFIVNTDIHITSRNADTNFNPENEPFLGLLEISSDLHPSVCQEMHFRYPTLGLRTEVLSLTSV